MRKLAVLCAGLLGVALLLSGCGGGAQSPNPSDKSVGTQAAPAVSPGFREQAPDGGGTQTPEPTETRKEVITGNVDVVAGDPVAVAGKIVDQVRAAGGRIDSRTEQPGADDNQPFSSDDEPSAALTVRMPADKTDAFITGLGSLGRVTEITTNRDDVTMQWQDLDARIKALQASVDRLRALMAGATNTADLITAEGALSSRQAELDSLTARKRSLDDQVALSTLTISITTDAESKDQPDNFWEGIVSGWNSLWAWLKDAVVVVGAMLPWLVFLGLLGAAVWFAVRSIRRRLPARAPRAPRPTRPPYPPQPWPAPVPSAPVPPAPVPTVPTVPAESRTGTEESSAPESGASDHKTEQP
ncbi:DUF4349 domain-containing protein [Nocardia sp. NPDC051832]|uniref:DUF4349 domain-containing protein n=1 Tax=Nocardia sp. NPDC051832 TaxID=3155673 RepID=UPI00343BEEFE